MYKKLVCFDFDKTLINTPEEIEGKKIWQEKTGKPYPHIGWWSKEESLDPKIFDIGVNDWVYERYLEEVSDSDNYVILATGRLEHAKNMRNLVEEILIKNNLSFDGVYLSTGGDTYEFKRKLFEKLIEDIGVDEFTMYDDRQEHLVKFEKWASEQQINITIVDVLNRKTKTFKNKNI